MEKEKEKEKVKKEKEENIEESEGEAEYVTPKIRRSFREIELRTPYEAKR